MQVYTRTVGRTSSHGDILEALSITQVIELSQGSN